MGGPAKSLRALNLLRVKKLSLALRMAALWYQSCSTKNSAFTSLKSLHVNHPGICRMKAIARSYFWWGRLDKDIEKLGKSCQSCHANQSNPPIAPLHPWVWPEALWKRIHVDFAGPFQGHTFFITVDAYLKWPEAVVMTTITSEKTTEVLRAIFA